MNDPEPFELTTEEALGLASIINNLDKEGVNFNSIHIYIEIDDVDGMNDLVVTIKGVRK